MRNRFAQPPELIFRPSTGPKTRISRANSPTRLREEPGWTMATENALSNCRAAIATMTGLPEGMVPPLRSMALNPPVGTSPYIDSAGLESPAPATSNSTTPLSTEIEDASWLKCARWTRRVGWWWMRSCATDVSSKSRATTQQRVVIVDLVVEVDAAPELPVGVALRTHLLDVSPECVRLGDLVDGLLYPLARVIPLVDKTRETGLSLPHRLQPSCAIRPVRLDLRAGVRLWEVLTLRQFVVEQRPRERLRDCVDAAIRLVRVVPIGHRQQHLAVVEARCWRSLRDHAGCHRNETVCQECRMCSI